MPDSTATPMPLTAEDIRDESAVGNGRLVSNSIVMAAANVLSRGVGYLLIILMARRLESQYLGAYAIWVTTSMLLELVANLGLDKIIVREMTAGSAATGKGYFWTALPVRFGMALLCVITGSLLLNRFFGSSLLASPLDSVVYLSAIFPLTAARNCEAFLTAHEKMFPIAAAQLSERVIMLGAVVLLVSGAITFGGLLRFAPLAASFRLAIAARSTATLWTTHVTPQFPKLRCLIRQAVELLSVEILAMVYFRSDVFILANVDGLRDTGVYQVTYKIFDFCLSLFAGFLQAAFPRIIRNRSRAPLKQMLTWGAVVIAVPSGVLILARHIILHALRPEYVKGSVSLVWLMCTVPLVYVTSTLANAAIAAGRVKILIGLAALLLVSNIGLNLLLIPKWGINGAAFSTFACELLSATILGPIILRALPEPVE